MGDHQRRWAYSGRGQQQQWRQQHQQHQYQHQQQYSQQGSDEEDFFSYTESTTDQGAHSPNVSNYDHNDGYYNLSPESHFHHRGQQGQRQQQHQVAFLGQNLDLRAHRTRPPDNSEFQHQAEFTKDINSLFSPEAQPNPSANTQVPHHRPQGSREISQNSQVERTAPQLDNPQADPDAPSWTPVTLRTPRQRPKETFGQRVDPSNIDPRLLQPGAAQLHGIQPSSTATTQADYAPAVTPSIGDGVSTSVRSDASGSWICQTCRTILGDPRTLRRHRREVHGEHAKPPYTCPCGRRTKRLWNHNRHMENCRRREDSDTFYVCWCGWLDLAYEGHLDHIKECGKQTAGRRPRTQDAPANQAWF